MLSSFFQKCVTLETSGSRLPQREEDVAHDGGTADTRGSDDAEDVVHVVTQVLLKQSGVTVNPSPQRLYPPPYTHTSHHQTITSYPVCVEVLRLFELDRVDFTGFVFRADLRGVAKLQKPPRAAESFELSRSVVTYLIYDGLECDLQIVHPRQFHRLINALGGQRVSSENGVRIPTQRRGTCVIRLS